MASHLSGTVVFDHQLFLNFVNLSIPIFYSLFYYLSQKWKWSGKTWMPLQSHSSGCSLGSSAQICGFSVNQKWDKTLSCEVRNKPWRSCSSGSGVGCVWLGLQGVPSRGPRQATGDLNLEELKTSLLKWNCFYRVGFHSSWFSRASAVCVARRYVSRRQSFFSSGSHTEPVVNPPVIAKNMSKIHTNRVGFYL